MEQIQAIRGMNDILPDSAGAWHRLERVADEVFSGYGYRRIRLPIAERTELFKRSIGAVTDIVEKEMYTFQDRGGDWLSLRPEGTAGVVRAAIQRGLLYNQVQRLWYSGPMFRYERPQKGRYRQFHQFGVEIFGLPGPDVDAEVILMSARLWRCLGIRHVKLQLNTLGTPASRRRYREHLIRYFRSLEAQLDDDSRRRLATNPLRILDSKAPAMQRLLRDAPSLLDHLDAESASHFQQLRQLLDEAGVAYQINPRLVRGLDYYTRTVFEWVTDRLGAQDAVCSGGRYDGLVQQLGGRETPGIGFALGVERLLALMEIERAAPDDDTPHAYLVHAGDHTLAAALNLGERLRDAVPGLRLLVHAGGGSFKTQLKRADRSGALFAVIVGEDELARSQVQLKPLRGQGEQQTHAWQALPDALGGRLSLPASAPPACPSTASQEH